MTRQTRLQCVAAAAVGVALVVALTAPSEAQFGRSRSRGSSFNRNSQGASSRPATTRPAALVVATAVTAAHPDWNWYDEVVVQQNMFLRQRGRDRSSRGPALPSAGPSATTWVLRGTVLEADDRVAFLENERTGATIRVHVGESVGSAKVVQVEHDYLEIENRGAVRTVAIGTRLSSDLAGLSGTLATTQPAWAGGAGEPGPALDSAEFGPAESIFVDEGPADGSGGMAEGAGDETAAADNAEGNNGGAPAAPLSPEEEILQRLRARRNEELNK